MNELAAILALIDRALRLLDSDNSDHAMHSATQALAARQAIDTVHAGRGITDDSDFEMDPEASGETAPMQPSQVAVDHTQHVAHDGCSESAASLLAGAERRLTELPGRWRNEIAICAAASYLRRARRALATS